MQWPFFVYIISISSYCTKLFGFQRFPCISKAYMGHNMCYKLVLLFMKQKTLGNAIECIKSIKDYENLLSQKIAQRAQSNIN